MVFARLPVHRAGQASRHRQRLLRLNQSRSGAPAGPSQRASSDSLVLRGESNELRPHLMLTWVGRD